jgi:hypothetical protein
MLIVNAFGYGIDTKDGRYSTNEQHDPIRAAARYG